MTTADCLMSSMVDLPGAPDDIAAQAAMYRLIVENTHDTIIRYDAARTRLYVSPACREMFGHEPAVMLNQDAGNIIHPDDFAAIHPSFLALGPDKPNLHLTFRAKRNDGRLIWIEAHYRHVYEDGGSIAVMRDITDRKNAEFMLEQANDKLEAANDILRRLAQQDGLTGLANRRRLDEVLEQEFRRSVRQQVPLAVLLLDADNFKAYNDRYGHAAGDECLRRISRTIESILERPGDLAARYGGEEFVALLPATDLPGALLVAERLRAAILALSIEHLGSLHRVATISVGACAAVPDQDDTPAKFIEAADRSLYHAKTAGRNRVLGSAARASAPAAQVDHAEQTAQTA